MDESRNRPWGLTRLSPLAPASPLSYTAVHLDPVSQQAIYIGPGGDPIEAGRHGTNKETKKKEKTGGGDGENPATPDETEIPDYDND
ncbi:putative ATP-grasp-modified RiPP [Nonomuraea sp. NEAU-A123]|uniref:putative ATP-grasp-modified RiPP n=1 Tax=Nonomuraea sp. NEAU-A123 TaxID=2839649 RepID=UPI001BE3E0A9|nr:putative ATP-grasp-modified RiPP [Nonomuraea sp. NEAU-A123]MBT2228980.1 putative ATP-grasp-modified RiPP [Nonomuraea sp. NEAU-A123]